MRGHPHNMNNTKHRVTCSFQPTPEVERIMELIDRTPLTRSEVINEAVARHAPEVLRRQVSAIEKLLADIIETKKHATK